jgi:hypothetical protein
VAVERALWAAAMGDRFGPVSSEGTGEAEGKGEEKKDEKDTVGRNKRRKKV